MAIGQPSNDGVHERQPTVYHSHSRSRSLLSLPVTPNPYPRRKFVVRKPSLLPPLRKVFFFATFLSVLFLFKFRRVDVDLFAPQHLDQQNNGVSSNSDSQLLEGHVERIDNSSVETHVENVESVPFDSISRAEQSTEDDLSTAGSSNNSESEHASVHIEEPPESRTAPPSLDHVSPDSHAESQSVESKHDETLKDPPVQSDPDYRDPADFSTFDQTTALNYFHLHKTGGVSFKERLFDFFIMDQPQTADGQKAKVFDTCHMSTNTRSELGIEKEWSCDWDTITNLSEEARNKIDVIVGHQYWERGAGYWIPNRDMRYFTVMRHPLHRKISFFYHFFVRNTGRKEDSVTFDELIQFVLGKKMPESPLVRDAGPGYYASRLWSDGIRGYNDYHRFDIPEDTAETMVSNSIRRLRKNFVFIGLQTQEPASLCMLKKTVQAFAKAHAIPNMSGLDGIAKQRERMNTGSYALSGKILWDRMTEEQREEFKRVERVDLGIYRESVKMFREMVKRFDCADLVVERDDDNIAL